MFGYSNHFIKISFVMFVFSKFHADRINNLKPIIKVIVLPIFVIYYPYVPLSILIIRLEFSIQYFQKFWNDAISCCSCEFSSVAIIEIARIDRID